MEQIPSDICLKLIKRYNKQLSDLIKQKRYKIYYLFY